MQLAVGCNWGSIWSAGAQFGPMGSLGLNLVRWVSIGSYGNPGAQLGADRAIGLDLWGLTPLNGA